MVISRLVRPLTIETRDYVPTKHAPEMHFVGVVWVIAHVGFKRKL
ncbi:hypothetical protein ACLK17_22095 [Escherichia coli]